MRLSIEMLEDARGRRSTKAVLYLHGAAAWPEELTPEWLAAHHAKSVQEENVSALAGYRTLAHLDVLGPDELHDERIALALSAMRSKLLGQTAVMHDEQGVFAKFLRADRAAPEQEAVLDALLDAARLRLRRRVMSTSLRVLRLDLADFRGFERLTLALPQGAAVLVGANGAGKTTLLNAIALLLSHLAAGIHQGAP